MQIVWKPLYHTPMGTNGITVRPVQTRKDHDGFCGLPYNLYRNNSYWVPPLHTRERRRWSIRHNASLRYRQCLRFVAYRNGQIVGRIASIVNGSFETRWQRDTGFFGFFECMSDPRVARALLGAVETTLRDSGKRWLLGPINLTLHDEVGLLVDGFESRPMVLSPYNPPYYESLLVGAGLVPRHEYYAYAWLPTCRHDRAVERLLERFRFRAERDGVSIRYADARHWPRENRLLFHLYNHCFEDVWGFSPLSWEEHQQRADAFKSFYEPGGVIFAEVAGRPVGFGLAVPDINEALFRLNGKLWPFGWIRLAKGIRRIRSARFLLLGVCPEHRGRGIAPLIVCETIATAKHLGINHVELSLIQDTNHKVLHVVKAFGGQRLKTYRLYEKQIHLPSCRLSSTPGS